MKVEFGKAWILLAVLLFLILFSNIIISDSSNPFQTNKTCSQTWGGINNNTYCSLTLNDAFPPCDGTQVGSLVYVQEVYLNASSVFFGDAVNVTCAFQSFQSYNSYEYIWYNNDSSSNTNWVKLFNKSANTNGGNESIVFVPNSTQGTQIVRCIISQADTIHNGTTSGECANSTNSNSTKYDNDDVNFTVTSHLTYNFWNLTNYTTGSEIASGQTYNRNTSINVSAHWNKNISYAAIEINGTGTWQNYTICMYPNCTDNWTNYTINLSDATKYNQYNITINTTYVNDTTSVTNNTSPLLFFYLNIGSEPPNISSYWFQPLTNRTNLYTNLTIYANVSDDSGISTVRANLTYPSNTSVILNLTGDPNPGNQTWNYTFRTTGFTLNETGNYTVSWVSVKDNGNQEVNLTQNLTFYVTNNLNVSVSVSPSTPSKTQQLTVTVSIYDINNNFHQFPVNLTISCLNGSFQVFNFSLTNISYQTSTTNCYASDSYSTSFNIIVNASDAYNNTGEKVTTITTESAPSGGTTPGGGGGGGGVVKNITIYRNITSNATTEFNFTLQITEIQIYRGEDATIVGAISNTGNTNLTINSSVFLNSTCCVVSMNPLEFMLEVGGSEVPFTISIHVNTTTEPDTEHFADIILKVGTLEKSKRIKIVVKENPTISSIQQVTGQISDVEQKIKEYAELGINTKFLEDLLNKIKTTKSDSTTAIESDNINKLKQDNDFIQSSLSQINDGLNKLVFLKTIYKNKWNITSGIAIGIISTYLVVQVLVPYSRLEIEIRKLILERDSLVKSRVETEKSFFLRKIDDKTFRSILTDRQGKIYKLKSMIDLKGEEKNKLIRTRLNPVYFGRWVRQKVNKKTIKNAENKNKL